jgi:hypothetical protein
MKIIFIIIFATIYNLTFTITCDIYQFNLLGRIIIVMGFSLLSFLLAVKTYQIIKEEVW